VRGNAQDIPKGFELMELMKVMETYKAYPDLSFSINYTYADSAHIDSTIEQVNGSYKIHNGKYWSSIDSVEFLQGNQYNLAVYHKDSTILVNKRQEYASVVQIPIMDSLFREANVSCIDVVNICDTTRSLIVKFKPGLYHHRYEIQYDRNTNLIRKVLYYFSDLDNSCASGVICVKAVFSDYCFTTINEQYFDESKFLTKQSGQLVPNSGYAGFDVRINDNSDQ